MHKTIFIHNYMLIVSLLICTHIAAMDKQIERYKKQEWKTKPIRIYPLHKNSIRNKESILTKVKELKYLNTERKNKLAQEKALLLQQIDNQKNLCAQKENVAEISQIITFNYDEKELIRHTPQDISFNYNESELNRLLKELELVQLEESELRELHKNRKLAYFKQSSDAMFFLLNGYNKSALKNLL